MNQRKGEYDRRNYFMFNLQESIWPGWDRTRDIWIWSQTRICSQTRYRLCYAARYITVRFTLSKRCDKRNAIRICYFLRTGQIQNILMYFNHYLWLHIPKNKIFCFHLFHYGLMAFATKYFPHWNLFNTLHTFCFMHGLSIYEIKKICHRAHFFIIHMEVFSIWPFFWT